MPFIGAVPAQKYISLAKQDFTTIAGTGYTLDQSVTNEVDIALFINHVRQEPTTAYTASGTTLTLTSATTTSDDMYCVFLGKATETVNPPDGSVGTDQLEASAVTNAKIADGAIDNAAISSSAAIATTKLGAGAIAQVVSAQFTSPVTVTTGTSNNFADSTITASITPSSTSSKILVFFNVSAATLTSGNNRPRLRLQRGSTAIGVGTSVGSRIAATAGVVRDNADDFEPLTVPLLWYDSPATTSATTYKLAAATNSTSAETVYFNRSKADTNNNDNVRSVTQVILAEILA